MRNLTAGFFVALAFAGFFVALALGGDAFGQSPGLGGMFKDALGGALGRPNAAYQSGRGHFVQEKSTTMIFRADDKTYTVYMSAISAPTWRSFTLGQPV